MPPRKKFAAEKLKIATPMPASEGDQFLAQDMRHYGGPGLLDGLEQISFSNVIKQYNWKLPILSLIQAFLLLILLKT